MKIHHLSVAEAFASVQSSPGGLSQVEAARRLAEFGPNQVEQLQRESLARLFRIQLDLMKELAERTR